MKSINSEKYNVTILESQDELVRAIDKIIEERPEIFKKAKK